MLTGKMSKNSIMTLFSSVLVSTNSQRQYLSLEQLNAPLCAFTSKLFIFSLCWMVLGSGFFKSFRWKQLPAAMRLQN